MYKLEQWLTQYWKYWSIFWKWTFRKLNINYGCISCSIILCVN